MGTVEFNVGMGLIDTQKSTNCFNCGRVSVPTFFPTQFSHDTVYDLKVEFAAHKAGTFPVYCASKNALSVVKLNYGSKISLLLGTYLSRYYLLHVS